MPRRVTGCAASGFTERDYAAPASTDSRQLRFSTHFSTQRGSAAELRCCNYWSRPQIGIVDQNALVAFQAGHAGSIPVARSCCPGPGRRRDQRTVGDRHETRFRLRGRCVPDRADRLPVFLASLSSLPMPAAISSSRSRVPKSQGSSRSSDPARRAMPGSQPCALAGLTVAQCEPRSHTRRRHPAGVTVALT